MSITLGGSNRLNDDNKCPIFMKLNHVTIKCYGKTEVWLIFLSVNIEGRKKNLLYWKRMSNRFTWLHLYSGKVETFHCDSQTAAWGSSDCFIVLFPSLSFKKKANEMNFLVIASSVLLCFISFASSNVFLGNYLFSYVWNLVNAH